MSVWKVAGPPRCGTSNALADMTQAPAGGAWSNEDLLNRWATSGRSGSSHGGGKLRAGVVSQESRWADSGRWRELRPGVVSQESSRADSGRTGSDGAPVTMALAVEAPMR
jgi:hypothetical protein